MQSPFSRILYLIVPVATLLLGACSNRHIYEMTEGMREYDCKTLNGRDRDTCMEQATMPYREYERNRRAPADS